MRTADLLGALLDYHTARAEGVSAVDLEFRATGSLCVRVLRNGPAGIDGVMVLDYSTNPALWAPLIKKHTIAVSKGINQITFPGWRARVGLAAIYDDDTDDVFAPEPEIAICRAVVRAAFGDEVEDLPNA